MRQPFDAKKGDTAIITRFLQLGYKVLTPNGRNQRYDLVIEDAEGQFWCVQCKTARIQDNGTVVAIDTANHNYALKNKQWRHYRGQCDYFAVYCEELAGNQAFFKLMYLE